MKKIFNKISSLPEFEKDIKKLTKRFKTLKDDLDLLIRTQLNLYHKQKIDNKGIIHISGLKIENPKIYKAKKFACRSLKGKGVQSGIRVTSELMTLYIKIDACIQLKIRGNNLTKSILLLYDIINTQLLLDIRDARLYNMSESNGKGDHPWNSASYPYPLITASQESVQWLT